MNDVQEKITAILRERRTELPKIDQGINHWSSFQQSLEELERAVGEFRQHEARDDLDQDTLTALPFTSIYGDITQTLANLNRLKERFSRDTLNIGVSGRARVGKSTLLQSIAGLDDEQIPTGSGLPVTAVRSRIFYSSQSRAKLQMHSYDSFRREVLQPYHKALDLPEPPQTMEQFAAYNYPDSAADLPEGKKGESTSTTVLRRLKDMQAALPSYRDDLTGGPKEVGLDALRRYVAYPTAEVEEQAASSGQAAPRPYLAVKDVQIFCPFPYARVSQLGIIDLPGLGELAANAEEHHLEGLQNDVDVVLLVKRPLEGMAYWGKEDGAAANLLDKARGFVEERRDFVYLVINTGGTDEAKLKALRGDILRNVNDGEADKNFHVLETNAVDEKDVYQHVLEPVLSHLAERLPVMDRQILEQTVALSSDISQQVKQLLGDVRAAMGQGRASPLGSSEQEAVWDAADNLLKSLSVRMKEEVDSWQEKARKETSQLSQEFEKSVDEAYEDVCTWIDNGFGLGEEDWRKKAYEQIVVDKHSSGFIGSELNRIRVEISHFFSGLDQYLDKVLKDLWACLGDEILKQRLGNLLHDKTGRDVIIELGNLMAEAEEPCPALHQAVQDLLQLRLDYRTQLHHNVRYTLDDLSNEVLNPETGRVEAPILITSSTEAGIDELFRELKELARSVAYQTRNAMMNEYKVPEKVIHAAVEEFDDALIRSGASQREFRRLANSYRDDIWPGYFAGLEAATARTAAVKNAIKAVEQRIS